MQSLANPVLLKRLLYGLNWEVKKYEAQVHCEHWCKSLMKKNVINIQVQ